MVGDVPYGFRALRKSPGLTLIAVASLALAIGANTAIFTVLDPILLKWLPVKQPDQLVMFCDPGRTDGPCTYCLASYTALPDRNTVFSDLVARNWWPFYVSVDGRNEPVNVEAVSGNYFDTLRVGAFAGRTLTRDDDRLPGEGAVAVLSYDYWRSRFAGDPAAIGKTIGIQGHPFTIVGVTPPQFFGVVTGLTQEVRIPLSALSIIAGPDWDPLELSGGRFPHSEPFTLVGRLRRGVSARQAQASLTPLFGAVVQQHVQTVQWHNLPSSSAEAERQRFLEHGIGLRALGSGFAGLKVRFSQPLLALMALVGVLLLIASSTLANLLLARSAACRKEIALRLALGAGRLRILRQALVESLLLALHAWLPLYIRVILGAYMLEYGLWKVFFPDQMRPPTLSTLLVPFGDLSPLARLWFFMGSSHLYTFFTGTVEMVGGALLFVPGLTTLGALIAAAAMTNVVVLDVSYDVVTGATQDAILMLLMSIFLLAPELRAFLDAFILRRDLPRAPFPPRSGRVRRALPWGPQSSRAGERADCGCADDRPRGPSTAAPAAGWATQFLRARSLIVGSAENWDITRSFH